MRLILTDVYEHIRQIVYSSTVETGVTLFGVKDGEDFKILHVCGPGPSATHEELSYSADNDYSSFVYENLLKTQPELKHLGELHSHPFGMRRLSGGDQKTVTEVLKSYEEFIAGVMLRYRGALEIYPVYFSRAVPKGTEMENYAHTNRRSWLWWKRPR